jgi:hypothetical protein
VVNALKSSIGLSPTGQQEKAVAESLVTFNMRGKKQAYADRQDYDDDCDPRQFAHVSSTNIDSFGRSTISILIV